MSMPIALISSTRDNWRTRECRVRPGRPHAGAVAFAMVRSMQLSAKETRRLCGRVDVANGRGRLVLFIEQDDLGRARYAVSPLIQGLQWADPSHVIRRRTRVNLGGAVVSFGWLLSLLGRRRLALRSAASRCSRRAALDAIGIAQ
jgi:hypothetical protein